MLFEDIGTWTKVLIVMNSNTRETCRKFPTALQGHILNHNFLSPNGGVILFVKWVRSFHVKIFGFLNLRVLWFLKWVLSFHGEISHFWSGFFGS
jgi:hypothetical protein